jgi:hypothetical protein
MFLNNNIKIQFNKIYFQPTRITKKLSEFFNNFEKYGLDNYCKQSNFKKLELSFLSNGFNLRIMLLHNFPQFFYNYNP